MIGCLNQKADFERLLASPAKSRSAHFAVHHVSDRPTPARRPDKRLDSPELSTAPAPLVPELVDKFPDDCWLGTVVPKRHARRAVTRSLLKRQIRAALRRHQACLAGGLWLVRLRQPFAAKQFPSAASPALREAARTELDALLSQMKT